MQDSLTSSFRCGETFDTAPSSPERSLFCGRTRRSAPTRITSTRQFHSSNAVTPISVGADLCVRLSSPERSLFCGGVSIVHLSFERGRRLGILLSSDAKDVFRQVRFEVCKSDYLEAFSTLFASRSGVLRG